MSFDALAPHYRWMEWVSAGEKLQHCRVAFLDRIEGSTQVLILGEGNGRFLLECRRRLPQANIRCVDASRRMLDLARQRLERFGPGNNGVEFVQADALTWQPTGPPADLLVTHFFLDCFRAEQLEGLLAKLAGTAQPQCRWLLADFQEPSAGWRRWRARLILRLLYEIFRLATRLPARRWVCPDPLLQRNGFDLRERKESELGLLRSDLWQR